MQSTVLLAARRRTIVVGGSALALAALLDPTRALAQGTTAKLRIGTIGAGRLGGTVGALWVRAGHPVMFSSKDASEGKALADKLGPPARSGTVDEAIAFGDVVLLAVPYRAMPDIARDYGAALKGKIVLDAGNAVSARDGAIADEADREGIGLTSQKYLPGARIVRAFNTIGTTVLQAEAGRAEPRLPIPIAGDDAEAVRIAGELVRDAGFEPVVAGGLADARRFQRGAPGYGPKANAAELREKLRAAP
ncbi:MAG TPA: NAD(P)-binding domain-containing protein [Caldimonas sp.]|nr:NAD(P)-binding domain-containing protein [Caldimonas sp.]